MRNKYILMAEESGGEGAAGGGSENPADVNGGSQVLDGGSDGSGGDAAVNDDLLAGKFKTQDDLVKGYTESVSMATKNAENLNAANEKLKGFTGAPEGDYTPPDGFDGYSEGVMGAIQTTGKEIGLSQESYDLLMTNVAAAEADEQQKYLDTQMGLIGKDAQIRIDNANAKLTARFGGDIAAEIQNIASSAKGFAAVEALLGELGDATVNPDGVVTTHIAITQEELGELLNAKTEGGAPKMNIPEYKAMAEKKIEEYNKQQGIS